MIVDKIYSFLELEEDKEINLTLLEEYKDEVVNGVLRQCFKKREDRRTLRLSGIGTCLRKQAYHIGGYDKKEGGIDARSKLIFLLGDLTEAIIVLLAKSAGCDIQDEQKEVKLNGVVGHIDGILYHEGKKYLFECKSMNGRRWQSFKSNGMDNTSGYISQANSYAYVEECDGIIWVGFNKDLGLLHEEIRMVDHNLAEHTKYDIDRLKSCTDPSIFDRYDYEDELWRGNPTGNRILKYPCTYCDYVVPCWDGATHMSKGKTVRKLYGGEVVEGKHTEGATLTKL